jgi:hypothetical protein
MTQPLTASELRVKAEQAAKRINNTEDGQILFTYLVRKFGFVTHSELPSRHKEVDPYRLAADVGARGVMVEINQLLTMDTSEIARDDRGHFDNPVDRDHRKYE